MSSSKSRSLSPKEILQFADDIPKLHRRHKDKAKFLRQLRLYLHSISNNVKKQKAFLSRLNPNVSTSLSVDKMMEALWDDSATTFEVGGGGFNWWNAIIAGDLTVVAGLALDKLIDKYADPTNVQKTLNTLKNEEKLELRSSTFRRYKSLCTFRRKILHNPITTYGIPVALAAATGHFTRKPKVNKLLRKRSSSSTRRRQRRSPSNK